MDQLIPGRSKKANPNLIPPFLGLQVASFPSLIGLNLQAALASNPTSDHKMHTKRARDGHPEFAGARLDRFGHLSDPLLTLRGPPSGGSHGPTYPWTFEKANPPLIPHFLGLQVACFPSLIGPNLQAAFA